MLHATSFCLAEVWLASVPSLQTKPIGRHQTSLPSPVCGIALRQLDFNSSTSLCCINAVYDTPGASLASRDKGLRLPMLDSRGVDYCGRMCMNACRYVADSCTTSCCSYSKKRWGQHILRRTVRWRCQHLHGASWVEIACWPR